MDRVSHSLAGISHRAAGELRKFNREGQEERKWRFLGEPSGASLSGKKWREGQPTGSPR